MSVAWGLTTALVLAAQAGWAWRMRREEPGQASVAPFAAALALATAARAALPDGLGRDAAEVALGSVLSLGLLGLCLRIFGGSRGGPDRRAWVPRLLWLAAAGALGLAHPAVGADVRRAALLGLAAGGLAGAFTCIGRALGHCGGAAVVGPPAERSTGPRSAACRSVRARPLEPRLAHLTAMLFAAAAVVRLAAPAQKAALHAPLLLAGAASLAAHAWWTRRAASERLEEEHGDAGADDAAVDLRGADRLGHVVDVAEALRRRASRGARRSRGVGEG